MPLGNSSSLFSGGPTKPTDLRKSNIMTACHSGFLGIPIAVVTNPYSVMVQTVAEGEFDNMRVGVFNADTAPVAGVKVSISAGTTLGAANGTLGLANTGMPIGADTGFLSPTWGGQATGTLAASPQASTGISGANIGGTNCSLTFTDWIGCTSVPRADGTSGLPVYQVILTYPAGVNRTIAQMTAGTSVGWENEGSATVAPYNRPYRVMVSAIKDAVSNPAFMLVSNTFAARTYTDFPPIVVQYTLRNGYGKTFIIYGDSIYEGAGASIDKLGWPKEFQNLVSKPRDPVAICNLAVGGSGVNNWTNRIQATISNFSSVNIIAPSLSPNSLGAPILPNDIVLAKRYFGANRQKLDLVGSTMITSTVIPSNNAVKAYGASDSYRTAWNNYIRASGFTVADFDKVATSANVDANGQYFLNPEDTADGIHPSTVLYKKMANYFLNEVYKAL